MKGLIVTCFRNGTEGARLKEELITHTKKLLRKYTMDTTLEIDTAGLNTIKKYVRLDDDRTQDAVKMFDSVDVVVIDGDPSLLPWHPLSRYVRLFLLQCYTMGKCVFGGAFAAQLMAHIITLGGEEVKIFNAGGEGSSLDKLKVMDSSSATTSAELKEYFLDDSTGDLYLYDPQSSLWSLKANVGLKKFRCDPLLSSTRGQGMVTRSIVDRRTGTFYTSSSSSSSTSGGGSSGPSILHPHAFIVHPRTEHLRHWIMQGISMPNAMATGSDAGKGAFVVHGAQRKWDINERGCAELLSSPHSSSSSSSSSRSSKPNSSPPKSDRGRMSSGGKQVQKNGRPFSASASARTSPGMGGPRRSSLQSTSAAGANITSSSSHRLREISQRGLPIDERSIRRYIMRGPAGNIKVLAAGDRGVEMFEFGHAIGVMFHVDSKYPSSIAVLDNFIRTKLELIRQVGRLEYSTQREFLERLNKGELGPPPPPSDKYAYRHRSPHPPPPQEVAVSAAGEAMTSAMSPTSTAYLSPTSSVSESIMMQSKQRPQSASSLSSSMHGGGRGREKETASTSSFHRPISASRSDNVQASILEILRRIPGGLDMSQRKLISEMLLGEKLDGKDWDDASVRKGRGGSRQGQSSNSNADTGGSMSGEGGDVEIAYRVLKEIESVTGGGAVGRQFRADFVDIMKGARSQYWVDNDPSRMSSMLTAKKGKERNAGSVSFGGSVKNGGGGGGGGAMGGRGGGSTRQGMGMSLPRGVGRTSTVDIPSRPMSVRSFSAPTSHTNKTGGMSATLPSRPPTAKTQTRPLSSIRTSLPPRPKTAAAVRTSALPSPHSLASSPGRPSSADVSTASYHFSPPPSDNASDVSSLDEVDGGTVRVVLSSQYEERKQQIQKAGRQRRSLRQQRAATSPHEPDLPASEYAYPAYVDVDEVDEEDSNADEEDFLHSHFGHSRGAGGFGHMPATVKVDGAAAESVIASEGSEGNGMFDADEDLVTAAMRRMVPAKMEEKKTVRLVTSKPRPYSAYRKHSKKESETRVNFV